MKLRNRFPCLQFAAVRVLIASLVTVFVYVSLGLLGLLGP